MKIGELSSLAGCSVPAVRFYEAEGLLQAPLRAANNYRQYGQQHVDRLAFIVRCRSLDMSHDDIRALLQLQDDPAMSCDEVNALLDDQMRLVEQRIAELQALRKQLRAIRSTDSKTAAHSPKRSVKQPNL
ncbi:Cd(II)/Pb(II)-responsive transcriptional regulator [Burkholderia cenocepacia]|uniref:Cd(II)/Pb(II)-responsive transcriptional regulator n=1 Tax=Burkholderia cenocepacia TaxID=95486 RepID=UPI001B9E1CEA|nr:Cd(II)/Pb(II)-responsive transcriptional regulator [Burkholderia cenocepacia]MBR8030359.1 Cd(II)/Pb(II)-responsive transcriptional regulator [Burkholderia cenocepacia]